MLAVCSLLRQIFFGSFNSFFTVYGLFKKKTPKNISEMGFVLKLSDVNLYCFDSMLISQHFLSVSSGIDYLFVQNIQDLEITAVGQTRFLSSSNLHSVGDSVSFEIMHPFQRCGIVSDCSHCTGKLELVPSSFNIYSLIKLRL